MNLRDLRYLVAVADLRNFSRAAEAEHVSQPTLSAQIRKLEESLGITLFERDSRTVGLTPAGEAVIAEARQMLHHAAAITDIARSFRDPLAGPFRLGIIASLGPFLTPVLLDQLRHDAPRLEISVREGLTDDLLAALRARALDAVLVATAPDGHDLTAQPLFDEPFLLAHGATHPLAAIAKPAPRDLAAGTLLLLDEGHCLRDQALALCGTRSVDPRVKATSLLTLIGLAAQGHGATLVPALAAPFAQGLMLRPFADAGRQIRLVARRSDPRAGAVQVVAAAAQAVAAPLLDRPRRAV